MVYQGEQSGSIIIKGRVVDTYLHKNLFTTVDIAQLGILHNNSECLEKIKIKINRKKFYHIKNLINSINDNYSIIYETKEYYYCCLSIKNVKDLFKTKIGGFMDKLEMWFERIKNYPRLKLNEAQKLYKEMIKENDDDKKIKMRNNLINSTIYVILNCLKNSDLDILENGSYDMDDIISSTIEYYINEVDNGNLLNVPCFSSLFGKTYYSYLSSIFVPQKEDIEISKFITLYNFGDLMEIFLLLKRNNDDITFEDYLNEVRNAEYIDGWNCYKGSENYLYKCFQTFQNIYSKININDNNIPSKTKLMFMRHLLADISLREDFSLTPKDDSNFEDEVINDVLIKKSIDYIVNHSELQEREIDILIKRFGIGDESVKTLEQIGNIYRLSGARIGKIEENALKKLRNPKIKRNIYID